MAVHGDGKTTHWPYQAGYVLGADGGRKMKKKRKIKDWRSAQRREREAKSAHRKVFLGDAPSVVL